MAEEAHADANTVRDALESLVPYDLEGPRTFEALSAISARAESEADVKARGELAFVRAVALTDLWILAHKTHGAALLDHVAQAVGVSRDEVPRTLLASLDHVKDPIVADIVRDSRTALLLTSPHRGKVADPTPVGPRTSVLYIDDVVSALGNEGGSLSALAMLANDPCPQIASCAPVFKPFDETGRRALQAVETAVSAMQVLRDDQMMRDPFVQSIAARVEANAVLLPGAELAPNIRVEHASERAHLTMQGSPASPDMVAFIESGKIEVGFVPRVRVSPDGKLELFARGEPMLPATRTIAFGKSFPLIVRNIDEVVAALAPLHEQAPDARIAIAATPMSPAHLWARALLSAKSAGFSRIAMLGVGEDGTLRSLDVDVVSSLQAADLGPTDLSVLIRLGGFSVQRTGPSLSLPRLRNERGFTFDFAGLASSTRDAQAKTAKLSFMSDVPAETLAETAFMVAPQNGALTVVLP